VAVVSRMVHPHQLVTDMASACPQSQEAIRYGHFEGLNYLTQYQFTLKISIIPPETQQTVCRV